MQVDVLISTFDRLDTLKATVQSIRASSYKKLSILKTEKTLSCL